MQSGHALGPVSFDGGSPFQLEAKLGAQLVGEVVQYEDAYRLCYIRGPEGLLIGLAEKLG